MNGGIEPDAAVFTFLYAVEHTQLRFFLLTKLINDGTFIELSNEVRSSTVIARTYLFYWYPGGFHHGTASRHEQARCRDRGARTRTGSGRRTADDQHGEGRCRPRHPADGRQYHLRPVLVYRGPGLGP